ncbi:DNA primase [Geothermobacter ehrlichii]|uniref:DNA primase n=1 Tax=Geothermobacter ehrlichii TaxID=213224 RepID=A0A5D3WMF4_9BACT|nr:DNA primase [Geothermobacter ehrlichii]TYO98508.1 DNA primase [Geothermobacter ehrlichii]
MGRIPEETIERIRDRVDMVELVGRYVQLRRSGANNFGLCPFHGEKTPSFNVNSDRQSFHCFGCGEGGDAIAFLMKIEGLEFKEAVHKLAAEVGIEIAEERSDPEEEARRRELDRLRRVNREACDYFQRLLLKEPVGEPARRYLRGRGYDGELARAYRLGYALDAWEGLARHLREKGIDLEAARRLGLIRPGKQGRGDYDLFRGRLMFPIEDHYGNIVAFGGRALSEDGPKYLNSPESPIYHKGRVLYGLFAGREAMRKSRRAIVVEGYFDVLAMHRAGWKNTVATCGTAMTRDHARLLKRFADCLVLLFDQDRAGQAAVLRAMEAALPEGLEVRTLALDPGEDPDSFLASGGRQELERRLEAASPAIEWFMDWRLAASPGIRERAQAVDEILQRIGLLPGEIEQNLYLQRLARQTGLAEEVLRRKLARGGAAPVAVRSGGAAGKAVPEEAKTPTGTPLHPAEEMLLHLLAVVPEATTELAKSDLEEIFLQPLALDLARSLISLREREGDVPSVMKNVEPRQRVLLSGILEKDRARFGDDPLRMLDECRRRLRRERLKRRSAQLTAAIAEAQRSGDRAQLAALLKQKQDLSRRLRTTD